MNWNLTKLGFASVCALGLVASPALAQQMNGWQGDQGRYEQGWNGQNGAWNSNRAENTYGRDDHNGDQQFEGNRFNRDNYQANRYGDEGRSDEYGQNRNYGDQEHRFGRFDNGWRGYQGDQYGDNTNRRYDNGEYGQSNQHGNGSGWSGEHSWGNGQNG